MSIQVEQLRIGFIPLVNAAAPLIAVDKRFSAAEGLDGIGAFAGPAFDADDIAGHLAAWKFKRGFGG